ncbi:methyl-accepting chemotaxis sensory transducer [Comamonas thiooxydans]|nr:methyl-accepting chemotaxis sensory transducer [Comamonas thiooxydans]
MVAAVKAAAQAVQFFSINDQKAASMRVNAPVTQREYSFDEHATLMSTTDTESYIKYANQAFMEVSGFEPQEILGQTHNLVRRPDMPPAAFADLWATLKSGEPWSALVKNRRKNGDHYWVRANAIPIIRNDKAKGYMSVRTQPERKEVEAAQKLYESMHDKGGSAPELHKGIVSRKGLGKLLSIWRHMGVRRRIRLNSLALWGALVLGAWLLAQSQMQFLSMAAFMTVALMLMTLLLESQFATPLELLKRQSLNVATGNNRQTEYLQRSDEIGTTLRTVNQIGLMFRWLVDDVNQQALNVQQACNEIEQGNSYLHGQTEQLAVNVAQTSASMEQITARVQSSADTAQKAGVLASEASAAALRGGQSMDQIVSTMESITANSRRIADIVGVIDSMPFQTNLLALNAAVEAARAGEHGRGFAVVAGEVRALAQRSADAAKEIKALIQASTATIEAGSLVVSDAGSNIGDIVSQARSVADFIAEISKATREQSEEISQVGKSVADMDYLTQQNAQLVTQGAQASSSMQWQVKNLVEAIGVFR